MHGWMEVNFSDACVIIFHSPLNREFDNFKLENERILLWVSTRDFCYMQACKILNFFKSSFKSRRSNNYTTNIRPPLKKITNQRQMIKTLETLILPKKEKLMVPPKIFSSGEGVNGANRTTPSSLFRFPWRVIEPKCPGMF